MVKLDAVDRCLLAALIEDGRMAFSEIARRAGVAPATIHERFAKLRQAGIVRGFAVLLDPRSLGYTVTAMVHLRTELAENVERTVADLTAIPEVEEIHVVTGEYDIWVKVRARDTSHLQDLLINRIHRVTGFVRSATEVSLTTPLERIGSAFDHDLGADCKNPVSPEPGGRKKKRS
ncbi:MAG: Lrp/AsnC family transcriptional regulator [Acidobacteria bacterium]|nr:Lrp/AsnC family transcriptional regulator [Acidobacteriota bacterium]